MQEHEGTKLELSTTSLKNLFFRLYMNTSRDKSLTAQSHLTFSLLSQVMGYVGTRLMQAAIKHLPSSQLSGVGASCAF